MTLPPPSHPVFVLAPDSFKESMSAETACAAMAAGIRRVLPEARCLAVPMADGGEGTMRALVAATGGQVYAQQVTGPLGEPVTGEYGILGDGQTGVVELASASGLHLVPPARRDPRYTTTFGTGELIRAALARGVRKLIIGLGGSATNDGGAGIVQALGARLLDADGRELGWGGEVLSRINKIDLTGFIWRPGAVAVEVACDVTNPLTGEQGAAHVYGPQKGATPETIPALDEGLAHYAAKIAEQLNRDVAQVPGAGAAGGAGAGLLAFLDARLVPGVELVIRHARLEEKIQRADYVFTGEGSLDLQTAYGKTIAGIAALTRRHQKPLVAFAGRVANPERLDGLGLTAALSIVPGPMPLEAALAAGPVNLENAVAAAVQLIRAGTRWPS